MTHQTLTPLHSLKAPNSQQQQLDSILHPTFISCATTSSSSKRCNQQLLLLDSLLLHQQSMTRAVFCNDARDDELVKAAAKQRNALMHFDCFLKAFCAQTGIKLVEAAAIPHCGIPRQSSNKKVFEWWDLARTIEMHGHCSRPPKRSTNWRSQSHQWTAHKVDRCLFHLFRCPCKDLM